MSRRLLLILSIVIVLFFQIPVIKKYTLESANSLKNSFSSLLTTWKEIYEEYIDQKDTLQKLLIENRFLKDEIQKIAVKYATCKDLKYFKNLNIPNVVFTQVISYAKLPDFTEVYINYDKPFTTPRGLVYNNLAAGIAVKHYSNYSLALLNSNEKTSYTVYIGKDKIPGIFYGKINTIKYIPKFKKINIGDLVITSGLDGVFYQGAKVGEITEVKEKKLYKEAKVKLFYNDLHPEFFYVVQTPLEKIQKNKK
ncbi:putative periplasmic protein [Nautilia profundicola AmH]|uniref:Periplasmic protein n=1 Tax=Nautilia profundicola (strain ATCC BAA-1463 / DSM 18972 / AmH) TaxID=598659 RepID=B9L775_NAUPA|nr:rod shape-determining protein MreC [Nautilia profundicola]ACM92748.1 putative periplasmic protein [Nautilia profundicola AmH]